MKFTIEFSIEIIPFLLQHRYIEGKINLFLKTYHYVKINRENYFPY